MRFLILTSLVAALAGCSLFRDPPDASFLERRDDALAAPGESFVALSGGACLGACPEYEIFVFESGRVVFNGKRNTARIGTVELQTMPASYFELRKLLTVRRAYSRSLHWGCAFDQPGFNVGSVEGERTRSGYLNYGCFNQVDDLDAITAAFIRVAGAAPLIGGHP